MTELHLPWLEMAILFPLFGAVPLFQMRDADYARRWSFVFAGLSFLCAFAAWQDFGMLHALEADDKWHVMTRIIGRELFVIDTLSAPLLPLGSLLHVLVSFTTLRTKLRRFGFASSLVSQSLLLALFSAKEPWLVIALLGLTSLPPYFELRSRGAPTRVFALHMGLSFVLMCVGWWFVAAEGTHRVHTLAALIPLLIAVLIRAGIAPFHCWVSDLFEHASFATALLFVLPLSGAFAAARLVFPVSPEWVLRGLGMVSLATAVYASGMSLVQTDTRRFFCYLFLSNSALVLVGLEAVSPMGLTGALCVWLSIGLSLGGFGLTLRAIESRLGRLPLKDHLGLYEQLPDLSLFYMLTGLASVGFPGTFGYVGSELLVDGAVEVYPYVGVVVVLAAAINGVAVVNSYFRLFGGKRHPSSISLKIRMRERFAVTMLGGLLVAGGIVPQPGILSRHHAAVDLLKLRERETGESSHLPPDEPAAESHHPLPEDRALRDETEE
jgi:NADH-quinone oxidoreductase subunit M